MKKTFSFQKEKTGFSKHRCPECRSRMYEVWLQIDPVDMKLPIYHVECARCHRETGDFYNEESAPFEWETFCEGGKLWG